MYNIEIIYNIYIHTHYIINYYIKITFSSLDIFSHNSSFCAKAWVCLFLFRSPSWSTRGTWPEPSSGTRSTTPNRSSGWVRCASTSTQSRRTSSSSCPSRWPTPSSTTGSSTWACRRSWCRRPWLTAVTSPWLRLWRLDSEALPSVSPHWQIWSYKHLYSYISLCCYLWAGRI